MLNSIPQNCAPFTKRSETLPCLLCPDCNSATLCASADVHLPSAIYAKFFVQKRLNTDYQPRPQIMQHAREVIQLISAMAGDHRYEDAYNQMMSENPSGQKGVTMCSVYDQIENKGIEKGRQEGIEKGRQEGYRSAQTDNARSMRVEGLSLEQIARILHLDVTDVLGMLQQA